MILYLYSRLKFSHFHCLQGCIFQLYRMFNSMLLFIHIIKHLYIHDCSVFRRNSSFYSFDLIFKFYLLFNKINIVIAFFFYFIFNSIRNIRKYNLLFRLFIYSSVQLSKGIPPPSLTIKTLSSYNTKKKRRKILKIKF